MLSPPELRPLQPLVLLAGMEHVSSTDSARVLLEILSDSEVNIMLTHSCLENPKLPDNFGDISITKAILRTYLKEKCWSKPNPQLPLKYHVN